MGNSVFIADVGTKYGQKICDSLLLVSDKIIKTVKPAESGLKNNHNIGEVEWDNYSAFSHKNIIFTLRNIEELQFVFIVFGFPETEKIISYKSGSNFQKDVDFYIKSQVALTYAVINELAPSESLQSIGANAGAYTSERMHIFLVLPYSRENNPYREFFKSFINGILEDCNAVVPVNAFEAGKEEPETFARWAVSTAMGKGLKSSGKWFKYMRYILF